MSKAYSVLKKSVPYILILCLALLGTSLIFHKGLNTGDDYFYHLPIIFDKYEAIIKGQGLSGISAQIGSGIGYGGSLFYSPLSHLTVVILAVFFKIFGISLMTSYKIVLALSVFLSGVFMYKLALRFTGGNRVASLISSACLVIYPYRLFNMFCRLALAEAFAFTFVPLFFLGLYEIIHTDRENIKIMPFVKTVIGASLIYLSHNLTALLIFISGALLLLAYIIKLLPLFKKPKFILLCLSSIMLIVGICSVMLLSQLELLGTDLYAVSDPSTMRTDVSHVTSHIGKEWFYSGFLNIGYLSGLGYTNSFLFTGIIIFVISSVLFVLADRLLAKIAVLKYAHCFISAVVYILLLYTASCRLESILSALIFIFLYAFASKSEGKKAEGKIYTSPLFWLSVTAVFASLVIMGSTSFWENAPDFLLLIQFPWRLWSVVQFFVSVLVGLVCSHYAHRRGITCAAILFVSLLMLLNMPIIEKRNADSDKWESEINEGYLTHVSAFGHHKEYAPVIFTQSDYKPASGSLYYKVKRVLYGSSDIELSPAVLLGNAEIKVICNSAPKYKMEITVSENSQIQLPLLYYPGYKITANGKKIDAENIDGLVAFELNSGTYEVSTAYTGTPLQITGKVLCALCSTVTLVGLGYGIYAETGIKNKIKFKSKQKVSR